MSHICETKIQEQLAAVARQKNKNDKLAWQRKYAKMNGLINSIKPIEEKILALTMEKQPIMDDIAKLRSEMVKECIHPKDSLLHKGTYIECKFCYAKLSIPKEAKND